MSSVLDLAHALLSSPIENLKINDILDRPEIKAEVERPRNINRDHDVPYLAGSSKDGGTTFIDKRIPQTINLDGKVVDPSKYLNVHEQTEHALMEYGKMPYKQAHSIATDKEKAAVQGDGLDWKKYEETLNGYAKGTEDEDPENPPKDLY